MQIAVIGSGYVGLVTAACLADSGNHVVAVDSDRAKIDALRSGQCPFFEPGLQELVHKNAQADRLRFSTDVGSSCAGVRVVFLAVGTGIGAGILSGGRLIRGSRDIAGAVGWFGLDPRFKSEYAAMGCFEAEASGGSIGRKARELLAVGEPSAMRSIAKGRAENVTARTVVEAARAGDPLARHVLDTAVIYLAMGIANIVSILNPEMVVLGGGLFQAADLLLEPVRREFKRWAQPLAAKRAKIVLSVLGEDAGLYGAAKLAWDSVS